MIEDSELSLTAQTVNSDQSLNTYTPRTWTNKDIKITLSNSEATSYQYQFETDGSTWRNMTGNTQTFTSDYDGVIYFRGIIGEGIYTDEESIFVKIDKTDPDDLYYLTRQNPLSTGWYKTNVTVEAGALDDNGSGIENLILEIYDEDDEMVDYANHTKTQQGENFGKNMVTIEDSGIYYAVLIATDAAGNSTTTNFGDEESQYIKIDKEYLSVEQVEKSPEGWTNGNVTVSFVVTCGPSGIKYAVPKYFDDELSRMVTVDGYTFDENTNTVTFTATDNLSYCVNAKNKAETQELDEEAVINISNIDREKPTILSAVNNGDHTITVSANDNESGIAGYILTNSSSTPSITDSNWISRTGATWTSDLLEPGTYYVWVKDKAGNISSSSSIEITNNITGITINKAPDKTSYKIGETLDLTGGIITVVREDESTNEDISMTATGVTTSGFNSSTIGSKEITVTYNNEYTASFNVTVSEYGAPTIVSVVTEDDSENYTGAWTKQNVVITVTPDENTTLRYKKVGDTTWQQMTSNQITIDEDYNGKIEFVSYVSDTVMSGSTEVNVKIDKTAPTTPQYTISGEQYNGYYVSTVTLTITAGNDGQSGYKESSIGGVIRNQYAAPATYIDETLAETTIVYTFGNAGTSFPIASTGNITVKSIDNVGNESEPCVINITKIDTKAPSVKSVSVNNESKLKMNINDNVKLVGYMIKTTDTIPEYTDSNWRNVSELINDPSIGSTAGLGDERNVITRDIVSNGTKYIWVKDDAGFVSEVASINVPKMILKMEIDPDNEPSYILGDTKEQFKGRIKITYNDGTVEYKNISSDEVTVEAFILDIGGDAPATIGYNGKTLNTILKEIPISSIQVIPQTITREIGTNILERGIVVEATYEDEETRTIDLTEDMMSDYDENQTGYQDVTITYRGKTDILQINTRNSIQNIELTHEPNKKEYFVGEELDLEGIEVVITYTSGQRVLTAEDINGHTYGFDNSTPGEQTIEINGFGTDSVYFTVTVVSYEKPEVTLKTVDKNGIEEDYNGEDWTNKDVKVYLSASNYDHFQYKKTEYNEEWTDITGNTLTISSTYVGNIKFRGKINGNIYSDETEKNIQIDKGSPSELDYGIEEDSETGADDNDWYINATISVYAQDNEEGSGLKTFTVEIYDEDNNLVGEETRNIENGYSIRTLGEDIYCIDEPGIYTLKFIATDYAGNISEKTFTDELIHVNGSDFDIISVEGNPTSWTTEPATIRVTYSGRAGLDYVSVHIGSSNGPVVFNKDDFDTTTMTIEFTVDKSNIYYVSSQNIFGVYSNDDEINVQYVDTGIPEILSASKNNNRTITVTATDAVEEYDEDSEEGEPLHSGITGYAVTTTNVKPGLTDSVWNSSTSETWTSGQLPVGTYYVWVRDLAGNISNSKSITITNNVTKIEVEDEPEDCYIEGEELDLSDGTIKVTYEDGTTATISMEEEGVEVTGFNTHNLGEQTLTIKYKGQETTYTVWVENEETGISVIKEPNKTVYNKGEDLDLTGGKIEVRYQNGDTREIDMTDEDVILDSYDEYDKNQIGQQSIRIDYKQRHTTFDVYVINRAAPIVYAIIDNEDEENYNGEWTTENVRITAIKNNGDLGKLEYKVGDSEFWIEMTTSDEIVIDSDINNTIWFREVILDNYSTEKVGQLVKIDKTKPANLNRTISETAVSGWYKNVTISASAEDTNLKTLTVEVYNNDGEKKFSGTHDKDTVTEDFGKDIVTINEQGAYYIKVIATDYAGNKETKLFDVENPDDSENPKGTIKVDSVNGLEIESIEGNPERWTNQSATIKVKFKGVSGLNYVVARKGTEIINATETEKANMEINLSTDENTEYVINAENIFGDKLENYLLKVTKIDKVKPELKTASIAEGNRIKITAQDNLSGIAGYAITENNTAPSANSDIWVNSTSETYISSNSYSDGTYYVWVKDNAGNISETSENGNRIIIDNEEFFRVKNPYTIVGEYIINVLPDSKYSEFIENLETNKTATINEKGENDLVKTGDKLKVTSRNGSQETYTIIVIGDVNRDGTTDILDLNLLKQRLINKISFDSVQEKAANMNQDSETDVRDLLVMRQYIIKIISRDNLVK